MLCRRSLASIGVLATLAACSGKPVKAPPQSTLPTITFLAPAGGSHLNGVVTVTASATGAGRIAALGFTAPAALAGATPTLDPATGAASITADLDLAPFPDGPLTITVSARDEFGAATSRDLVVNVAKRAPDLAIARPAPSSTVKGVVTIEASAVAQAGAAITALDLVDPPAGCGTVVRADAASLAVTWDTTLAPEGTAVLHLRALDSIGLVSDRTLLVTVDNVPLGRIEAFVSAGTPIPDATVEVWALDDATGAVSTSVGARGLLGVGGPTDPDGRAVVTLSAENFRGPVSVVARAADGGTLSYLDPAPPSRTVRIPATLPLTSIVPSYATGASVTVPVTLWTTLADAEVAAYAGGAHRLAPTRHTVTEAAAFADPLFSAHLQAAAPRWALRSAIPAFLTQGPARPLSDRSYAALADVALAQLARDVGAAASAPDAVTAPSLILLLRQDLAADGQLDGKGAEGAQLKAPGIPPVPLDEDTLRVKLAVALDAFVRSASNLSGLDRPTLEAAGVYTTISEDASPLFGPKAPAPYDAEGPTLSVAVTHGAGAAPVGARNLVRGTVRVAITASDPAGVQAIDLALEGAAIPGTFSANADGSATLVATYDTRGHDDGLLAFSITAMDRRVNGRTTTYQVTADNTAPAIAIGGDLAARYPGAILLTATATDETSGVASCAEITRGAADGASAPEVYSATWTPPAGTADGALSLTFRACDLPGNCAEVPATVVRDTTPPVVTVLSAPSATSAAAATITARATDDAGVRAVYATNGVRDPVAGTLDGATGTWRIAGVPLDEGTNSILVWATDLVSPPNDSRSGVPLAIVTVIRDSTPPTPSVVADLATYLDETGLAIVDPAVPTYQPSSSAKVDPALGIRKVASRLGWPASDRPTVADLEGANRYNIPFIRVAVPVSATRAPIVAAAYHLTVDGQTTTGDLSPWRTSDGPGVQRYDVPISSNLAPALAAGTAATRTVTVTATFTHAAGIGGSVTKQLGFTVLPPPIFLSEDPAYRTAGDPRSTWFYTLAKPNYHQLWDLNNASFSSGHVRLLRFVVSNPAHVPVAFIADVLQGTNPWRVTETWQRSGAVLLDPRISKSLCNGAHVSGPALQGVSFDGYPMVSGCETLETANASTFPTSCWGTGATPAGEDARVLGTPWWSPDAFYTSCLPLDRYTTPAQYPITQQLPGGSLHRTAYVLNPDGSETPPATVNGLWIVPAASGGVPGRLAVYVERSASAPRKAPLAWEARTPGARRYQQVLEVFRQFTGNQGYWSFAGVTTYYRNFFVMQGWADLVGASEAVTGTLSMLTQGHNGVGVVGPESGQLTRPFAATIPH